MRRLLRYAVLSCLLAAPAARAQIVDIFQFNVASGNIPDADESGISDTRTVTSAIGAIGDVNVTLNIAGRGSGAFNGDLYVTLSHSSGYSVLLNRVGRRNTVSGQFGYADNGLNVTLDDQAANGDIHTYRLTLNGSHTTALSSPPLTGSWSPDARAVDPDLVFDTSPRTAGLGTFVGLDPGGTWTLFVADLESGATAKLISWGLLISSVPEPAESLACAAGSLLAFAAWRRWRKASVA